MIKFAPEGYPYITGSFLLTVIFAFITKNYITAAPFTIFLFMLFFFRDVERTVPDRDGAVVSPADGRVIYFDKTYENEFLKKDVRKLSIFMSPLNVHINRVPYDGTVISIKHTPGGFRAAYRDEASIKNENIAMVLRTKEGDLLVRQVAGFLARRAVCRVRINDSVKRGQRSGIIKFSSRVELYLPLSASMNVKVGDKVKAGETIVAQF